MLRASHPLEDKPENAQPPHQVVAGKARSIPLPPPLCAPFTPSTFIHFSKMYTKTNGPAGALRVR